MAPVHVAAIGLAGPGLPGWRASASTLAAESDLSMDEWPTFDVRDLLPANERRRITPTIKLALQVASEAMHSSGLSADEVCAVFASSAGDTELVDKICRALLQPDCPVSPTQFHNSVHNAPAGYWAIATGSHMPYSTVSAYDGSFAAGLLEAAACALVDRVPVLLVGYDYPFPQPLAKAAQSFPPFGVALMLSAERPSGAAVSLALDIVCGERVDRMGTHALEALRVDNPAARCLPLLSVIARGDGARVVLPYVEEGQLAVEVRVA